MHPEIRPASLKMRIACSSPQDTPACSAMASPTSAEERSAQVQS